MRGVSPSYNDDKVNGLFKQSFTLLGMFGSAFICSSRLTTASFLFMHANVSAVFPPYTPIEIMNETNDKLALWKTYTVLNVQF